MFVQINMHIKLILICENCFKCKFFTGRMLLLSSNQEQQSTVNENNNEKRLNSIAQHYDKMHYNREKTTAHLSRNESIPCSVATSGR